MLAMTASRRVHLVAGTTGIMEDVGAPGAGPTLHRSEGVVGDTGVFHALDEEGHGLGHDVLTGAPVGLRVPSWSRHRSLTRDRGAIPDLPSARTISAHPETKSNDMRSWTKLLVSQTEERRPDCRSRSAFPTSAFCAR
jgi:hypothetical protein